MAGWIYQGLFLIRVQKVQEVQSSLHPKPLRMDTCLKDIWRALWWRTCWTAPQEKLSPDWTQAASCPSSAALHTTLKGASTSDHVFCCFFIWVGTRGNQLTKLQICFQLIRFIFDRSLFTFTETWRSSCVQMFLEQERVSRKHSEPEP